MPFTFVDRVPSKPGRVKITPENGGTPYYAIMERADEPSVVGSPLSAANLNAAQESLVYSTATGTSTWKSVYIGPSGKDTNAGTQTAPMATVKAAIRKYAKWHKALDIFFLDGTYTENIGAIATDQCNVAIRSASEDKEKVTLNMTNELDCHINLLRLYNITINVTAADIRPVIVNAGTLYAYNVRINMPETSTASCVNVYNGSTAWLMNCVLNGGAAAGVYANQGLLIRAYNCTSERTLYRGFYATNGSVIEYSPTVTATNMTYETNNGKCIPIAARVGSRQGSIGAQFGRYRTSDGLLMQWGQVSITPTAANTPKSYVLTFPIPYQEIPLVYAMASVNDPSLVRVSTYRANVEDPKTQVEIFLTRNTASATFVIWFAIGKGLVDD